ncbi:MAG: hypothetical protein WEC75_08945 [Dehalococcoidia bacterium]
MIGLLLVFAWSGRTTVPVAQADHPAGFALSLDTVASNGLCNTGDGVTDSVDDATSVFVGTTHLVGICLSGQATPPGAFTVVVNYNPGYDPSTGLPAGDDLNFAPEIADVAPALADNPDANDGDAPAGDKLGGGWDCTAFGVAFPQGDDTVGTPTVSDATITCAAAIAGPDTDLTDDPGLLATITYDAINPGVDTLTIDAASNVDGTNCGLVLTCQGATITKLDSADIGLAKSCLPAIGVGGGTLVCTLTISNSAASSASASPRLIDFLPGGTTWNAGLSSPFCGAFTSSIILCEAGLALGPLAPGGSYPVTVAYDIDPLMGGKLLVNAAFVFDGPPLAVPPIFGTADPNLTPLIPATPSAFANLFIGFALCLSDRYDGTPFDPNVGPPVSSDFIDTLPGAECDNSVLAANPVAPADLSGINKSGVVAPAPPSVGDTVTWTVNVPNSGLSPAPFVIIEDTPDPATQTLTAATVSGPGIGPVIGTDAQCAETGTTSADITTTPGTAICTLDVDNDSDGAYGEDPADEDGDGSVDEDTPGDANGDTCPGFCFIDDDQDGVTDEGVAADDDEDGLVDEDTGLLVPDDNDLDGTIDEDEAGDYLLASGTAVVMTVTATLDALALECTNDAQVTFSDPVVETASGSVLCTVLNVTMYKDKHPETAERDNVVNLWICEPAWVGSWTNTLPDWLGEFVVNVPPLPAVAGCNENGEGRLLVAEVITSIFDPEGLGAFEVQIKYDHKIFDIDVTPTDFLYSTGRVPTDPSDPETGGCLFSIFNENAILFGCVSKDDDQAPPILDGPTGTGTVAVIEILPEGDLKYRLHPGQQNGIVRRILDENCEAADIFGDPLATADGELLLGIAPGGLIEDCDDLDVTVRILEGDLDLNCLVDVADDQAIAFRYGAFFGSLLYDPWFDLEPALKDFDIDIKDLQKVFGRNGSTCSQSGLPEDGTFPAQEPQDALSNGPL